MTIKEHFKIYAECKTNTAENLKKFTFLDKKSTIIHYLKKHKSLVIKNINYAFFESNEPHLLSVFSEGGVNFVHINAKNVPMNFTTTEEYENYLAIFGTFAVLIDENFQISSLEDSRMNSYAQDLLSDLTFFIYYDKAFRLNLKSHIRNEFSALKTIYDFGYDYILRLFVAKDLDSIARILGLNSDTAKELYELYESKLLVIQ